MQVYKRTLRREDYTPNIFSIDIVRQEKCGLAYSIIFSYRKQVDLLKMLKKFGNRYVTSELGKH